MNNSQAISIKDFFKCWNISECSKCFNLDCVNDF